MRFIAFFILFSVWVSACTTDKTSTRSEKIARAYCECTTSLGPLNQKAATQSEDSTNTASFYALLREMEAEHAKAKECLISVMARHGKLSDEELDLIEQTIAQKCPLMSGQPELTRELLGQ